MVVKILIESLKFEIMCLGWERVYYTESSKKKMRVQLKSRHYSLYHFVAFSVMEIDLNILHMLGK